jgi:ferredoxin--NADP+ reductase
VARLFAKIEREPGFTYRLGVEVGRDVTHAELLEEFDAVLYASGAATDRPLDLPGVDLPGCTSATDVVGWYNGHPDHVDAAPDLSGERVVLVGAGHVALDVARILATDPDRLAGTSIAPHALDALRASNVREVVLLARRGAADAAFTLPELTGLLGRSDIDVVAENLDRPDRQLDLTQQRKLDTLEALSDRTVDPGARRIVLRFHTMPTAVLGDDQVTGIRVQGPGGTEDVEADVVLRAIGYHGVPLPDLPFDEARGVVPNDRGRVGDRTYVVGWIKRGPTGFIGTNKTCAQETVEQMVQDANAGRLTRREAPVLAS